MTAISVLVDLAYIASIVATWIVGPWPLRMRLKWASAALAIVGVITHAADGKPFWAGVWVFNSVVAVIIVFLAYCQRDLEDASD